MMLEVVFYNPFFGPVSSVPAPDKEFRVQEVLVAEARPNEVRLYFSDPYTTSKVASFMGVSATNIHETMVNVPAVDGRWHVNHLFYEGVEFSLGPEVL